MGIGWIQIAKAAAIVALIAAVVSGIWYGIHAIHEDGRAVERADWLAKENEQLEKKQKLLDEANARNLQLAAENTKLNDKVTNNAAKENEKVRVADAALRRDPDGLRIPAATCRANPVPGAGDSTPVDNGGGRPGGIRLPERTEEDLYDYAFKANRTRVKRDECRQWALGLQKQRDAWEREQGKVEKEDVRGP
ncbi:MAG TPA: lysis system i-spanin subunit Rz [Anaerolineaceae bacterium]|nr:lysis system i-spanin subunit Rz [Anaerolineaceae bacterium]